MKIGLIVGSGMDWLTPLQEWSEASTPYGLTVTTTIPFGGRDLVVVRRHGPQLNVPPHLINYRANLWALREAGVKGLLATAAVGSLRKEIKPGTLALARDFIDFSKRRDMTIYDRPGDRLKHVDISTPYCPLISSAIEQAAVELGIELGHGVVYVCVDGPRYETPAESRMFAVWGGDVVGMTSAPEAVLAREMEMCYASLTIVTNYAAGISKHRLTHEEVLAGVASRRQDVHDILQRAVALIPEMGNCCSVD